MPNTERSKLLEKVRALPHEPGVYLMKDRLGTVLYVGKAKDLKKRVGSYFQPSRQFRQAQPKVEAMIELVHDLETVTVRNEPEALLLEGRLIKEYRPRYNTLFTDDKRFLLVRVDLREPLPRFRLVRQRVGDNCRFFGPFAHSALLRRTLAGMRRQFGILLGDAHPTALPDGSWQLYSDARAEISGHPNVVSRETYAARLEEACAFLEGKSREWVALLREDMAQAAERQEYEKAAELRDVLQALEKTLEKTRKFERPALLTGGSRAGELEALAGALGLPKPPERLECFDISHISGSFCVASMVSFWQGKPDKDNYRRYRIQSFTGNDDYRAMAEVVGRRYRRLQDEGRAFPDLIVIDGGLGQVNAALAAFQLEGLDPPPLIGLAKREELIVRPGQVEDLRLPGSHLGLRLIQRIRDEAHRFANKYNAEWRSRRLRETVLDDFSGLGPVRKAALLDKFRTIEAIRQASPEELTAAEGIGPVLAGQLHRFLHPPTA